ncbi:polysaccharide pyruvyl transferase family protein [Fusobacterium ulcerans]|uniref:polysaccharide pyruvyl transferase family protein n=1 Tax=Fusobacterium ulcerans TaxID=861 RepID=UPI001D0A8E0E|nr:polysaccharide pyruvyl transferase family protein [Fusobacterium ulcerans]MCB8565223.1 polysaccharide pyruvyl transferase family protein [Fusobacterium ulcerans]MCB8649293.1 polysaccharide pyruvyl transferase family protein [Fusobacterium ulcerans]
MKKIGTITFHCAYNYGAMLQTYALQQKIKDKGYKTEVINFVPDELNDEYKVKLLNFSKGIKKFISSLTTYNINKKREEIFKKFLNEKIEISLKEFRTVEELKKVKLDYDLCITGSDQVWNPAIVHSTAYFLDFGSRNMGRISYAASFGQENILKEYERKIGNLLKNFDFISIREKSGVNLVKKLSEKNAIQVLDPVFLLSKEEWKFLENDVIEKLNLKNGYILLYSMEKNQKLLEYAEKIKEHINKPIVIIHSSYGLKAQIEILKSKNINIAVAGPQEFITLFVNADFIITNSFHGTSFSIIFDKPFLSIPHSTRNTRLESILNLLKLEKRFLKDTDKYLTAKELLIKGNFKDVDTDRIMKKEIEKSENFLFDSIEYFRMENE